MAEVTGDELRDLFGQLVEPRERNLLLNPGHAEYHSHVKIVVEEKEFRFDPRVF